jgi:hopanoid biosynthesis associated radical SAM protein HpnH
MPVPISQMVRVVSYIAAQKLRGNKRYPLVLMLEPLYRCNLACAGCGKIQYPSRVLKHQLSVEECLRAADECATPIVSIPGGEPLMHPQIREIVEGLVARKKYLYLCTNALLLEEKLDQFTPSKYLTFSVHLDGLEAEHDASVCRPGTYQKAHRAIELALARGFRVTTNTTLFDGADPDRTAQFFDLLTDLGVEGMMVSPGYSYEKAPDQDHFLPRERTVQLFRKIFAGDRWKRWRFNQSPLFLEFLLGTRDLDCTPWGNPSYGVFGWQKPCYLLQDGYAETFAELVDDTRWDDYGPKSGNPQCANCMVHSGFEPSSVEVGFGSLRGFLGLARAALFGPKRSGAAAPAPRIAAGVHTPAPRIASAGRGFDAAASTAALRAAFDYRGDVTLTLADGTASLGFVANLTPAEVHFWPKGTIAPLRIPVADVTHVALTERDPAAA